MSRVKSLLIAINVRENRRDNQVWTTQRNKQRCAHRTLDEDMQNKIVKLNIISKNDVGGYKSKNCMYYIYLQKSKYRIRNLCTLS
jgi:hypothetical protein